MFQKYGSIGVLHHYHFSSHKTSHSIALIKSESFYNHDYINYQKMQLKAIGKCRNLQLEKNVKANLPNHQWQPSYYIPLITPLT